MAITPGLELPFGIQPTNPVPVDAYKGPYASVAEANASIPLAVRYQGQEVIIITGGMAQKYTYAEGTADGNLVPFSAGTVYTFSQGVQESAGTVTLGGDITSPVELIVDAFSDSSFSIIDNQFLFGFGMWPDFSSLSSPFNNGPGVGFFTQGSPGIYAYFDGGGFNIGSGAVLGIQNLAGGGTQMLVVNNSGTVQAQALPSGVAGANTQVQFNNSGAFGASANFTYSSISNELTVGELLLTGAGGIEFSTTDAQVITAENIEFSSLTANGVFTLGNNLDQVYITALSGVGTRMVVTDASGLLSTQAIAGVAGADTEIQFNNAGSFGADSRFTFITAFPGISLTSTVSRGSYRANQTIVETWGNTPNLSNPHLSFSRYRGTIASPLAVQNGDNIHKYVIRAGYTTSELSNGFDLINITATGDHTAIGVYPYIVDFLNDYSDAALRINANLLGFFATTPIAKPSVTGSRGGNAALASLLTELANLGLVTDSTTA